MDINVHIHHEVVKRKACTQTMGEVRVQIEEGDQIGLV